MVSPERRASESEKSDLPDGVTVNNVRKLPNELFPGTQLDLDLLTAIARIRQIQNEGPDTCGGLILDRLITCDMPRLAGHVSAVAREWAITEAEKSSDG